MRIYCGMQLSYANLNFVNFPLSPHHPRGNFFCCQILGKVEIFIEIVLEKWKIIVFLQWKNGNI